MFWISFFVAYFTLFEFLRCSPIVNNPLADIEIEYNSLYDFTIPSDTFSSSKEFRILVTSKPSWIDDVEPVGLVGSWDTPNYETHGFFIEGDLAYVIEAQQFAYTYIHVINITDRSDPVPLCSKEEMSYEGGGVYAEEDYIYVAAGTSGLMIYTVTDPSNPTFVGSYDTNGQSRGVFVEGLLAFVADNDQVMKIVDISTKSDPTLTGSGCGGEYDVGVIVDGNYAYLFGLSMSAGVRIVDISSPDLPTCEGQYSTDGAKGGFVEGNTLYLVTYGNGVEVFDVSSKSDPTPIASFHSSLASGVYVDNGIAYLAAYSLYAYDVSAPDSPDLKVTITYPSSNAEDVFVRTKYAYVRDRYGLRIFDLDEFELTGTCTLSGLNTVEVTARDEDGSVVDSFTIDCLCPDGWEDFVEGLKVVDLETLTVVGNWFVFPLNSWYVVMDNGMENYYVYLVDKAQGGLLEMDVSNKTNPFVNRIVHTFSNPEGLAVGSTLFPVALVPGLSGEVSIIKFDYGFSGTCNRTGAYSLEIDTQNDACISSSWELEVVCSCNDEEYFSGVFCDVCILSCSNEGYPNDNCTACVCSGSWEGLTCGECNYECENDGTPNENCEECICPDFWTPDDDCGTCDIDCQHSTEPSYDCASCECDSDPWTGTFCEECSLYCYYSGFPTAECDDCVCDGYHYGMGCLDCLLECENDGYLYMDVCEPCYCKGMWYGDACNQCAYENFPCEDGVLGGYCSSCSSCDISQKESICMTSHLESKCGNDCYFEHVESSDCVNCLNSLCDSECFDDNFDNDVDDDSAMFSRGCFSMILL